MVNMILSKSKSSPELYFLIFIILLQIYVRKSHRIICNSIKIKKDFNIEGYKNQELCAHCITIEIGNFELHTRRLSKYLMNQFEIYEWTSKLNQIELTFEFRSKNIYLRINNVVYNSKIELAKDQ